MTHHPIRSLPATAPAPPRVRWAFRAFRASGPLALGLLLALLANAAAAQPPGPAPGYDHYDTAESQPPAYDPNSGPNSGPNAGPNGGPGNYDPSAQPAAADDAAGDASAQPVTGSYGYLRLVEGSATLTQASSGSTLAAGVNQPIMVGDRIMVPPRGRVEVVLADHNVVRLDGDTRLQFTRLANSADRQDPSTELRLDEGNLQLIVAQDSVGQELPTVLTPNASTYIQAYGNYRITADRGDFTEVVVRRGTAEVVADSGDSAVHAGEEAMVDSHRQAGIDVHQAAGFDALERWARQRDDETRVAQSSYVDPSLSNEAAPLDQYGHWINDGGRDYWQPNGVDSGWSPYWEGHWDSTPSGQFWVSSEPWGWVPYHYGTWDYLPAYGWAWQPGYAFAPAWVYWYWGPSYVGWCPIGLYTGFYGNFFAGFRFGLYGWAGGGWGGFRHWNFVGAGHFFDHDWNRWGFGGGRGNFPRNGLARGVITTDARGITPGVLRRDPTHAMNTLVRGRNGLADVTPFVQHQTHLSGTVAHAVSTNGSVGRLNGTPLQPRTLGAHQTAVNQGAFNGGVRGSRNGPAPAMPPGRGGRNGLAQGFGRGSQNGLAPGAASGQRGRQLGTSERGSAPSVQQHMSTFGSGRSYQGGTTQAYPSHPAPARPPGSAQRYQGGGSNGWSSPSSPAQRYQVTPRNQAQTPRYNSAPQSRGYQQNMSPRYQGSPGYQGYQAPRSYQSAPRYQSTPQYHSAPQHQSAPRYQSAPHYSSPPRSSAPHYSAPRSAPSRPSRGSSGGGGRGNSGSSGHSRHTG